MIKLKEIENKSSLSLEELVKVEEHILNTGYIAPERVREILKWFIVELGIDDYYFKTTSPNEIAKHLIALNASRLVTKFGGEEVGLQLINERDDRAVYIVEEISSKTEEIEKRIERLYPMCRIESYKTKKSNLPYPLRFYIVTKPKFKKGLEKKKERELTFEDVASEEFLKRSEKNTIERYKKAWEAMNNMESPYICTSEKPETNETRIMVGIHGGSNRQFLTNFSHLLYKYKIHSNRKYREIFYDKKRINTFYFDKIDNETLKKFTRDLNAVVMLPDNPITELFLKEIYSAQEVMYAISAAAYTHQFLSILTEEYITLERALKDQPEAKGILENIKHRLIKDTFSTSRIAQCVIKNHEVVSLIFSHFEKKFYLKATEDELKKIEGEILTSIERDVPSENDRTILKFFLHFNDNILKTNFFMLHTTCMSYRLKPSILNRVDFPDEPFGIIFLVGREFIGFHVRFRDIARGGIRIVRSRNLNAYSHNVDTIFMENYNLASTQQKKNKDIPEGGSKGTILLNLENQSEAELAFKSYVDGLLDVIMPNEEIHDLYRKKEILFLGPDEGTAELMNWAATYAKRRNYPFWKAFSTGKSPELGGIPHDLYGMTTIGVHEYVLGVLEKLNLKEENITKIQTGGPDGDLGSNEILISKDKTIAIVDGSGVLYDPNGINRDELTRLAKKRVMVDKFNRDYLSKVGFFISINDKEITLPDGFTVHNGEDFRNRFHLLNYAKSDIFVPCGGRPGAINITNWKNLFDSEGKPKFKAIVEGANLFITEDARLRLEENGIILFKDASTNKGGVTSSSLEVYASLALSDEEYDEYMRVHNGKISDFRRHYVDDIINRIKENARAEFNLLWKEHEETGIPFTLLTNKISKKINDITDSVYNSDLPRNTTLKEKVIEKYTPQTLIKLVGIEKILKRVPENYLNAIVATKIAIDFVYKYGTEANEVDFYTYLRALGR